jgi:ABC-type antimicrobial peptide transport system permease subunit
MTIQQTLLPSLLGVLIGIGIAYVLARLMANLLYQIVKPDPWTFLLSAALLMVMAFLASYIPARRASQIDPLVALRDG